MVRKTELICDFCGGQLDADDCFALKSNKTQREKDMCSDCYQILMSNKDRWFRQDTGFLGGY